MDRRIFLFVLLSMLLLVGGLSSGGASADSSATPVPLPVWQDENILPGVQFYILDSPSMALDPDGRAHFVFGQNHLFHSWFDGLGWQSERLDMSFVWNRESVLAINDSGTLFIAESEDDDLFLRILEPGGSWQIVRAPFKRAGDHSIALDGNGWPHVVVGTELHEDKYIFVHGHYGPGGWSVERIVVDGPSYRQFSIAIDRHNRPVILYERYDLYDDSHDVRLLRHEGQSWQDDLLEVGCLGGGNSLALDEQDKAHAVFSPQCGEALTYAHENGPAWELMPVTYKGESPALALDSNGRPHIVYDSPGGQVYAILEGESWKTTIVQAEATSEFHTLLLDNAGAAHISSQAKGLQYATNISGQWQIEKVAERESFGMRNALALDEADMMHILYHKDETEALYWTAGGGNDWETELLANGSVDRLEFAIDVDTQGRPHAAILVKQQNELMAGSRQEGAWTLETIATGGRQLSLAVDSNDRPHLAVINNQGSLTHWTKEGDEWIGEVVEEGVAWMGTAWLALDSQDRVHVAYTDGDGTFLARRVAADDWVKEPLPFARVEKLVFGPDDRVYILYTEEHTEYIGRYPTLWVSLWFAERDGEGWSVEWLWEDEYWDAMSDIAIVEDSLVHIVLRSTYGDRVYYQRDDSGEWLTEYLFRPGYHDISMAVAQDGQPRMLWYNASSLFLAKREIIWLDEFRFVPVLVP